jgi:putative Holliday junction resolvase
MRKFLGIDYGTKRIGLATNTASLVEPLCVIDNKIDKSNLIVSEPALAAIEKICQEKAIEQIIVGLSEGLMAEQTKLFAQLLEAKINLPVTMIDETLSSYEVARKLKAAHFSLKKRQEPIDHYSAALILEDFLESSPA